MCQLIMLTLKTLGAVGKSMFNQIENLVSNNIWGKVDYLGQISSYYTAIIPELIIEFDSFVLQVLQGADLKVSMSYGNFMLIGEVKHVEDQSTLLMARCIQPR